MGQEVLTEEPRTGVCMYPTEESDSEEPWLYNADQVILTSGDHSPVRCLYPGPVARGEG